eukprot:s123_g25.t1
MKPETIMLAFSEVTGTFLSRRLTTAEANMWLKEVLMRAGLTQAQACKYSTHSCKATVPTWAGKFGGFSMDERRLLTHHMEAGALMPLTYSRDNVTALQSRVFRMLAAIRNGEFSPDDSNARRILRENLDLFPERDEPLEWTGDWADSESDVFGDENFMEGSYFMGSHHIPAEDISGDKLVHRDSMVVHLKRDLNTLWCGRKLSTNYRKWEEGDPDFSQLTVLSEEMPAGCQFASSFICFHSDRAALVSLESKAAWEARARAIGAPEGFIIELQNGNSDSFGQWAFCCSCDQNSLDDTPMKEAVQTLIGRDVTPQEMVLCRRLYFEGRTYAISDMQSRIERTSNDKPRTMPLAERMARIERQKGDLVGVTWTAELELAHKLVDKIVAMQEDGNLLFIPPNACVSRVQEIQQEKHEVALTFDANGSIRVGKKAEDLKCDTNGNLNLRNAWTRRNLAYDQAGLASFVVVEKWTTKLMLSKLKEPPAGFPYITIQQICECDREMWLQLAQLSRGQLQPPAPDVRPFNAMIEQLTTSPEVLCFLVPLKGGKRESNESTDAPGPKKPKAIPSALSAPSKTTPKPADQASAGVNWRKFPAGCQRKGASGWRCLKYQWGLCNKQKEGKCKFGIHECFKCGAKRPYNQCEH